MSKISLYYKFRKLINYEIPVIFKKYLKKYYGKNNLDFQIQKYLNKNNGYFIEIGAHDGITQSNTYFYEKNKDWSGILIEPSKSKFLSCKKNRSQKNFIYNNACVSFKYNKKYVKLLYSNLKTFTPDFMPYHQQKDHMLNKEIFINEKNYLYYAKSATLNSLLIKSRAPRIIDFFSLDTEGAEFEVLGGIDYKRYMFRYILVETNNFHKLKKFLIKKNYRYVKKFNDNDYLFKL